VFTPILLLTGMLLVGIARRNESRHGKDVSFVNTIKLVLHEDGSVLQKIVVLQFARDDIVCACVWRTFCSIAGTAFRCGKTVVSVKKFPMTAFKN